MILKKKVALHTLQKDSEKKDVFKQNTNGKNIKEVLTDTNPPQNPILQVCYVEGGLVKTGEK